MCPVYGMGTLELYLTIFHLQSHGLFPKQSPSLSFSYNWSITGRYRTLSLGSFTASNLLGYAPFILYHFPLPLYYYTLSLSSYYPGPTFSAHRYTITHSQLLQIFSPTAWYQIHKMYRRNWNGTGPAAGRHLGRQHRRG